MTSHPEVEGEQEMLACPETAYRSLLDRCTVQKIESASGPCRWAQDTNVPGDHSSGAVGVKLLTCGKTAVVAAGGDSAVIVPTVTEGVASTRKRRSASVVAPYSTSANRAKADVYC